MNRHPTHAESIAVARATLSGLELEIFDAGYRRGNEATRWYPVAEGQLAPPSGFECRVEEGKVLIARNFGGSVSASFDSVGEYFAWCAKWGRLVEPYVPQPSWID